MMISINKSQGFGIIVVVFGMLIYFLTSHTVFGIISGVLSGVGISFIFFVDAEKTLEKLNVSRLKQKSK